MSDSIPSHRKRKCRFERELNVDLKIPADAAIPEAAIEGPERLCPDWDGDAGWFAARPAGPSEVDSTGVWPVADMRGSDSWLGPPPSFMK